MLPAKADMACISSFTMNKNDFFSLLKMELIVPFE